MADPLQNLVDRGGITHTFCNQQALSILEQDGLEEQARLLRSQLVMVNRGTLWADRGWKYFAHYLEPVSGKGLGPWPDAAGECDEYYQRALACWHRGRKDLAFFYLGAAVHLVQNLCVPYHACGVAFNGHQKYEAWAQEHCGLFRVNSGGYYQVASYAGDWVYANAYLSREYYPRICIREQYHEVTRVLLDLAQRTTAGFFTYFLSRVT